VVFPCTSSQSQRIGEPAGIPRFSTESLTLAMN
jgi:hypothetical protein